MSQLASRRETKIEPSMDRTRRELCGEVTKIVWRDEFGTAVIARLRSGETIRGSASEDSLQLGTPYRFMGRWANSDKYGWQFAFEAFLPDRPATHKGLTTYLAREIAGIGPATADRLWSLYGADAVEVLREDVDRIVRDGVLRYEVAVEASRTLRSLASAEKTTIDLFELFAGRGFPRDTVKACIDKWGVRAADMVRRDPYAMLMAKLAGVGFVRADKLYLDLGYSKTQLRRQILCVWHAMETDSDGHTWFDPHYVRRVLIEKIGRAEMRQDKVLAGGTALRLLAQTVDATTGKTWITEAKRSGAETRAAVKLRQLMAGGRRLWPDMTNTDVLTDHQRTHLLSILGGPVAILAGVPGTGKTLSAAILLREVVKQFGKDRIAVCAPTGKAAVRISDALARYQLDLQATTIHRLLGVLDCKGGEYRFEHDAENPLRKDVVVVDEASMLDVPLFASLLAACPVGTNLLFLGDPYQLPPVGHGCPLRDMMAAGVPNAILTEIKRQGETTAIVRACVQIKDGRDFDATPTYQPATGDNLVLVETETPEDQVGRLEHLIRALMKSKKYDAVADVQVLCSRNDAPEVGRKQLNLLLQSILNPAVAGSRTPEDSLFRRGDKVMCLKNGMIDAASLVESLAPDATSDPIFYDTERDDNGEKRKHFLANGDMGVIVAVDDNHFVASFSCPPRIVKVKAKKRRRTWEDDERGAGESEDAAKFDLAYAVTVHKSQGSEWPIVIAIIDDGGGLVASREYHYTAISRASDACFLIGRRETIRKQCGRVALRGRKTLLRERLLGEVQS